MFPHLPLLCRCAAQQHVEQNVRQQVDRDLVVVFDDETTAGEDSAGQLVSHLKNETTSDNLSLKKTFLYHHRDKRCYMIQSMCICLDRIRIHHLTLLMRYPAQVADQSENLLPPLLKYTGFFSLDQLTSFWLLLYLKTKREMSRKENFYLISELCVTGSECVCNL